MIEKSTESTERVLSVRAVGEISKDDYRELSEEVEAWSCPGSVDG